MACCASVLSSFEPCRAHLIGIVEYLKAEPMIGNGLSSSVPSFTLPNSMPNHSTCNSAVICDPNISPS
ncbi:expressed protein [Echinococcus multilocularis]|uniref:Expressed protein n=1 Tax=Echinococcus multilocularis TaxID=6211 RepID=A0A068Y2Z3_ECHMU|nr:expressed protein [Echinococcus multilocularis]